MKKCKLAFLSTVIALCMLLSTGCINININTGVSSTAVPTDTLPTQTMPDETTDTAAVDTESDIVETDAEASAPATVAVSEELSPDVDPDSPEYAILQEYSDMKKGFWMLPDGDALADTTWYAEEVRDNGDVYWYELTIRAGGADIRWNNDGEDHEYVGAFWTVTHENGVAILELDLGGLAGVQKCAVLMTTEANLLYTCANMVEGDTLLCGSDVTARTLERTYG